MKTSFRLPTSWLTTLAVALVVGCGLMATSGEPAPAPRLAEAEIFVELNDTDGDLGLHASIDGEAWTSLTIVGPQQVRLLDMLGRGPLRTQGLTQLSFESAEPPFEELPPAAFFTRFPEGRYDIEGIGTDSRPIRGTAILSHVLGAPPANILIGGVPAADSCDASPLPQVQPPVLIDWDPVTGSHPDIGRHGPVKISSYQLIVERQGVGFAVDLPPSVTEFEVPPGVTALGSDFKFEIIVRTTAGNNTAVESCFTVQ